MTFTAIALAALLSVPQSAAEPADTAMARQTVKEVNESLARFTKASFEAKRPDVEYRSEVTAWSDAQGVRKLAVTDRDDSGDVVTDYYYASGSLVFVYQAIRGYNDAGKQVTRGEERQYFRDGKMVAWLSGMSDRTANGSATSEFAEEAKVRLAASTFYVKAAGRAGVVSAPSADTTVVGKETKRTVGVVTGLEAGDVACYLSLKDDRGAAFQEMADFSICEQESLVGKRVTLTYKLEKVLADSCQGDPACKDTKTVALVTAVKPVAGKAGAAPAKAPAQTSFCTPMEDVIFACQVGTKLVSVCASKGATANKGYVQYRFGKPDSRDPLEMVLPEGEVAPSRAATGESVPFAGGGGAWLRFRKADTAYVVYSGIGKWGPKGETMEKQGVVVERGNATLASLPCTGPLLGELGPDWFERVGVQSKGEDFLFPDPPATKRR
jgi:hypothetical protein